MTFPLSLFPKPFGYWQGDYFSVGLKVPASYCLPSDAALLVSTSAIELTSAASSIASTQVWHDAWTPSYPREGTTRCGVVTQLDVSELTKVQINLGLRLAWFIKKCTWKRESDYGDFKLEESRAIVIEPYLN